jgi:hypothetical protein
MLSHSPNLGSVHKFRLDSNGAAIDPEGKDFELLREQNQERQFQLAKEAFQKGYGCRLKGDFTVKEVPGNFHISSHAYQNIYARLRIEEVMRTLDMSHEINYLFFGDLDNLTQVQKEHPEAVLSKLNGHSKIYDMSGTPHSYISHYHLDIVPTVYRSGWFETHAYQYTYNHNTFEVNHMPSLYFNYHIGGLVVEVRPESDRLSTFLIKLCAIIGGTYTLASFLDHALDSLFDERRNRYQLVS